MTLRILIIGVRSWGGAGNIEQARRLSKSITAALPSAKVSIIAAEDWSDTVKWAGENIHRITTTSFGPQRLTKYLEFIQSDHLIQKLKEDQYTFCGHIDAIKPTHILTTKGIIGHLLAPYTNMSKKCSFISIVTNHGLASIHAHICRVYDHFFVPFKETRKVLELTHGIPGSKITVSGPLAWSDCEIDPASIMPRMQINIVVLGNRTGGTFVQVIQRLLSLSHNLRIYIVSIEDPELESFANSSRKDQVVYWPKQSATGFLNEVSKLRETGPTLLISKTGPNTMLEAAKLQIPVVLLKSWLPMEEWVASFVNKHRLGLVTDSLDELGDWAARFVLDLQFRETQLDTLRESAQNLELSFDIKVICNQLNA